MAKKESASEQKTKDRGEAPRLVAKKAFVISHNDYCREIKAGDDISDVPELYFENLRTEGVL